MSALTDAAFGPDPGCWPLPAAHTRVDRWHRAVAAGGQGRYGTALAELEALEKPRRAGRLTSLALSTRASFLRQLGWHAEARGWDGRAWALAGDDAEAGADALVGLAADALGLGRFAVSARLLRRADELSADSAFAHVNRAAVTRLPVRLAWVSAELAMATGEASAAVVHAERAVSLASSTDSARHAVKSAVVLAAALCCRGEVPASGRVADPALRLAQSLALMPLSWALACLLAEVGSEVHSPEKVVAIRDESAATIRRRGGVWAVR